MNGCQERWSHRPTSLKPRTPWLNRLGVYLEDVKKDFNQFILGLTLLPTSAHPGRGTVVRTILIAHPYIISLVYNGRILILIPLRFLTQHSIMSSAHESRIDSSTLPCSVCKSGRYWRNGHAFSVPISPFHLFGISPMSLGHVTSTRRTLCHHPETVS